MRWLLVIVLLLSLALGTSACTQSTTSPVQPDVPRYTADQVISVVQAQFSCYSATKTPQRTKAMVSVVYQRQGVWEVKVSSVPGYTLQGPNWTAYLGTLTLHFYEDTGSLGK